MAFTQVESAGINTSSTVSLQNVTVGIITASTGFVGNLSGTTTGTHVGGVVGNVTGNVTGNVNGNLVGIHTGLVHTSSINDGPISGTRNRIINGEMLVNQRGNSSITVTGATNAAAFFTDRFRAPSSLAVYSSVNGVATISRTNNATSIGFPYCLSYTVNTAGVGGSNRDISFTYHQIESTNLYDIAYGTSNAKTLTLSFWIRSSLVGQRSLFIFNPSSDRFFITPYTINSANTWEYKTIIIPGDTVGTLSTTDGAEGLRIEWRTSCSGTTLGSASISWATLSTNPQRAVTGDVDFFGTAGATMDITGIQLEVGSIATPFEKRMIPYETTLCQRYYYQYNSNSKGQVWVTYVNGDTRGRVLFPVPMRVSPTISFSTNSWIVVGTGSIANPVNATASGIIAAAIDNYGHSLSLQNNTFASATYGDTVTWGSNTSYITYVNAEYA